MSRRVAEIGSYDERRSAPLKSVNIAAFGRAGRQMDRPTKKRGRANDTLPDGEPC